MAELISGCLNASYPNSKITHASFDDLDFLTAAKLLRRGIFKPSLYLSCVRICTAAEHVSNLVTRLHQLMFRRRATISTQSRGMTPAHSH